MNISPDRVLLLGANGQVGRELQRALAGRDVVFATRAGTLADGTPCLAGDLADAASLARALDEAGAETIVNAAAYTAVDAAETPEGRVVAWRANATGPATLAGLAREWGFTLVHYSSEYVFDGTVETEHTEDEPLSPLGVYAQTKAAGDIAVGLAPRHYILRTSWVIGEGNNFVRTMRSLAEKGVSPSVVSDQVGRLTFTSELSLPGGPGRLLVVTTDRDVAILDLENRQIPEITVRLTSGPEALLPAGVVVSEGDPARSDDARIAVRLEASPDIVVIDLAAVPDDEVGTTPQSFRALPITWSPDRQEVRIVAAATRAGEAWCTLRFRAYDEDDKVLAAADLVPPLVGLLRATLDPDQTSGGAAESRDE